ncbi:hypothetical protein ACFL9T_09190 [Thermodesulfobacteriota bacterium]
MKTNIIYACKYKLIGIDSLLPLLMEIKVRLDNVNIIILYPDLETYYGIKKNNHIWKVLVNILNQRKIILRYRIEKKTLLSLMSKVRSAVSLVLLVFIMMFRKNILIKTSDVIPWHNKFVTFIKKISSTVEVYVFTLGLTSEHHALQQIGHNLNHERMIKEKTSSDPKIDKEWGKIYEKYDYFISSNPLKILKKVYDIDVDEKRHIQIGYPRKLPRWYSYVEKEAANSRFKNQRCFVFFLSGVTDQKRYPMHDEPFYSELIMEVLLVLKKYTSIIKTIFKPHIVTDINKMKEMLNEINYQNYEISYDHPMILSYNAEFVLGISYSTVFFDTYFLGKPIVLYTQYDPKLFQLLGGKSEGGEACDFFIHRDAKQLDTTIKRLTSSKVEITRDAEFMKTNFPDTSPEFWRFWKNVVDKK